MVHHTLKTDTQYYKAVERGDKTFEVRKNDRDFNVGDIVHLEEVVMGKHTGRKLPPIEIKYILKGGVFGLNHEYCVFCW